MYPQDFMNIHWLIIRWSRSQFRNALLSKKRIQKYFLSTLLLAFFFNWSIRDVWADTLILNSGKTVEGKIIQESDGYVTINFRNLELTYYRDEIKEIQKETAVPKNEEKNTVPAQDSVEESPLISSRPGQIKKYTYQVKKSFSFQALADLFSFNFSYPIQRDDIPHQKISNVVFSPTPTLIKDDPAGNKTASFSLWNVKKGTKIDIQISYTVEIADGLGQLEPKKIERMSKKLITLLAPYLTSEEPPPADRGIFVELVAMLLKGRDHPYDQARGIYDYLIDYIQYENTPGISKVRQPYETYIQQKGNCVDIALLFVNLTRVAGIPSRIVNGLVYQGQESSSTFVSSQAHTWAEIYLSGYGWVPVDPTFGIKRRDESFCFPYRNYISEYYGQSALMDAGMIYRGSLDIQGWPMQNMDQAPVTQDILFEIEPLSGAAVGAQSGETRLN